ncbi:MAG: peptidylprolyl isomerase [Balneolaceae bacterium]
MKKILASLFILVVVFGCNSGDKSIDGSPKTDDIVIISTNFGDMYVVLYDETPLHKENFLKLANEGFYDSTTFHRVIEGFMIQGGDPNSKDEIPFNDGQGGPGYTIEAEFNPDLYHKKGALAAARLGGAQNPEMRSSGSQFYIVQGKQVTVEELDQTMEVTNENERQFMIRDYCYAPENKKILEALQRNQNAGRIDSVQAILDEIEPVATAGFEPKFYTEEQKTTYSTIGGTPFLDYNYTVYGEVIRGLEIVDEIAVQEKGQGDRPVLPIMMSVRVETMDRADIEKEFGYSYK